jgi:hypothetical protein
MRAARFAVARPAVCTLVAMAYDQELAGRIRQLIGSDPELTEKKMFGGLAFLVRGNMAIAASSEGGAMVGVDPAQSDALVETTKATPMNMRGRDMRGWLRVSADDLRTDHQLAPGSRSAPDTRARYRPSRRPPEHRLQPSGPTALIILMRRCVVQDSARVDDGRGSGSVQIARSFRAGSETRRRTRSRDGCPVPTNLSYC